MHMCCAIGLPPHTKKAVVARSVSRITSNVFDSSVGRMLSHFMASITVKIKDNVRGLLATNEAGRREDRKEHQQM